MLTLEQIENWRAWFLGHFAETSEDRAEANAICDLAKLALSPLPDVAGLVSELQALVPLVEHGYPIQVEPRIVIALHEAADTLTALSVEQTRKDKRIAELEAGLKEHACQCMAGRFQCAEYSSSNGCKSYRAAALTNGASDDK